MGKAEIRRFIAIMEFFYGFLFGAALLGAVLVFLISPDFLVGFLFALCVFSFFIFLCMITRYCIIRTRISMQMLESNIESKFVNDEILLVLKGKHKLQDS